MTRLRRLGFVAAALVVTASLVTPTLAWAKYRGAGVETNTFATHVLLAPGRPSCSGLGVLSVTLSWSAPSDSAYALSYELGESGSSGGSYSYSNVGNVTSVSIGVSNGSHFYVVRTVNHNWRGIPSVERQVNGVLFLAANCP